MARINYKLDLTKYNLVELQCFLDAGVISVTEFDDQVKARSLMTETVTPMEGTP